MNLHRAIPKLVLVLSVTLASGQLTVIGRVPTEAQTYQEMFDKADLVVIASSISTKETKEQLKLLGTVDVVGVETEFVTRLTLKGSKDITHFILHHYQEPDDQFTANGPFLIKIKPGQHAGFLMFLVKDKEGRYAPVTGQVDPALFSILQLRSGVVPEESW